MRDDDDPLFGDNESDWHIYKELNKGNNQGNDVFEDEEKIENELSQIEESLSQYDPNFWDLEQSEKKTSFIDHFLYGVDEISELKFIEPESNVNNYNQTSLPYQLHINIERIRVPEILFQPSIIGMGSMGIVEVIDETFSNIRRNQNITSTEVSKWRLTYF